MKDALVAAFTDMREEEALQIAREMLAGDASPMVVLDACRTAMEIIGQRFEAGEAFVPELMIAGEMMKAISAEVKPRLSADAPQEKHGTVLMGTVAGDIHDIGKDIVVFMLEVSGFEVIDLGVDVPVQTFVERLRETGAEIVGMSCLLTLAYDSMKATVDAIVAAGLRDQVKIMLGGASVDETIKTYTGADAYGKDAVSAVSLAKQWVGA